MEIFDKTVKTAFDDSGKPKPGLTKVLDTVLRVQRPVVLASIRRLRKKHREETPEQIARRLEKLFLRDVTVGGGAIGASAFVPGVGTLASAGLSLFAIGGYLERTAIYCQSMAELYGVHVENPEKARTMTMALMLGEDGNQLMSQILSQGGKASGVTSKWGLMMGKSSQQGFSVSKTIRKMFFKRFLARQSGAMLGRALPFGIGAVVGGGANLALGKQVVSSVQEAFGPLPKEFPSSLRLDKGEPELEDEKDEQKVRQLTRENDEDEKNSKKS